MKFIELIPGYYNTNYWAFYYSSKPFDSSIYFENGDDRIWVEIYNYSFTFNKLTLEYVEIYNRD
jgi:hypothetical protein